jgi:hypothetical protein
MKGLGDNLLQKFDNLGLRNKELNTQDEEMHYPSQKRSEGSCTPEKQEITIKDFNV